MDGGALVGSGTYGCIFDPPLRCKDPRIRAMPRAVGKISEPVDVENEISVAVALQKVPNASKYFVLPVPSSVCEPVPEAQQPDRVSIQQCDMDAFQEKGFKGLIHFQMPYGGISISKRFGEKGAQPTKPVFPVLSMIRSLLESVAVLSLNGFIHFDLHARNVLVDPATERIRLIDFGMTVSSRQLTEESLQYKWRQYSPDFSPESPEITLIQGVREKVPVGKALLDMIKQKKSILEAETLLGLPRQFQYREFKQFWTTSRAVQANDWIAFMKLYWPAIDAWGLGVVLLHMYKLWIQFPSVTQSKEWTSNVSRIKEVLRGLLRMDPRQRFDAVEALSFFDPENPVVSSPSGKAWLEQRSQIRAAVKRETKA